MSSESLPRASCIAFQNYALCLTSLNISQSIGAAVCSSKRSHPMCLAGSGPDTAINKRFSCGNPLLPTRHVMDVQKRCLNPVASSLRRVQNGFYAKREVMKHNVSLCLPLLALWSEICSSSRLTFSPSAAAAARDASCRIS